MKDKDFEQNLLNTKPKFPKFLFADIFEDEDVLFILHTESPAFIMNNDTKEIKFFNRIDDAEKDSVETKKLIENALAWADLELDKFDAEFE